MSKHKQPGGIWTAQYAHCAMHCTRASALRSRWVIGSTGLGGANGALRLLPPTSSSSALHFLS